MDAQASVEIGRVVQRNALVNFSKRVAALFIYADL